MSGEGAKFVGRFEGFRPTLYDDPAGHCTIGYGHLVHKGPRNGSEPAEFQAGISVERAQELLLEELDRAARAIRELVRVNLSQCQFDALASFVYNVGQGNFSSSTLLSLLNQGRYGDVPAQLRRWNRAGGKVLPGLVRRREAEGLLFSTGSYGP